MELRLELDIVVSITIIYVNVIIAAKAYTALSKCLPCF